MYTPLPVPSPATAQESSSTTDQQAPVTVLEAGKPKYRVTRDNLSNVVVWNPWADKAKSMPDFAPDEGFKEMLCVEPGSVGAWQSVEAGDAFEGAQCITLLS